jgi:hypothetical protein
VFFNKTVNPITQRRKIVRESTKRKLFNGMKPPSDHNRLVQERWYVETDIGNLSYVRIGYSGVMALIQEFPREVNGFNVYIEVEGNSLDATQSALGLVAKD